MLAGGRGRRMGGEKATVALAGRPLVAWPLDALRAVTPALAVVAKPETVLPQLAGVELWREPEGEHHPRHGLVHALRRADGRAVLVVAADLPLVAPAALRALLAAGAPAVARAGGGQQPLCALYGPEALEPLAGAPAGEPLTATVERLEPAMVDVAAGMLLNVNTPDDLARAESALRPAAIETERLRLVPATVELVDAELEDPARLAAALGVRLPADWPPEHHEEAQLRFTRERLEDPAAAGWWLHWFVWTAEGGPALVGTGGYVGPPDAGVVEIGYSVVPSWQRRGIATEATAALVTAARSRGARTVVAQTLPGLEPSIGVLRKLGFEPAPPPEPGVLEFRLG